MARPARFAARAVFRNTDGSADAGSLRAPAPGRHGHPIDGLLIQDRAVGTDLSKKFVYVVGPKHDIQYRTVTLGPIVDGLRVVRSGLEAGEPVVVNGLQRVRPGVQVTPVVVAMDDTTAHGDRAVLELSHAMKFSKFFIDRPIFAAVLSLRDRRGRSARAVPAADQRVPAGGAADRRRARHLSRARTRRSSPRRSPRRSSSRSTASRTCSTCSRRRHPTAG